MVTIVQKEESVLRKIAKEVPISQIKTPKIHKILKDMSVALDGESDGVAIAAPQISVSLRIFAVSGMVFDQDFLDGKSKVRNTEKYPNKFFINPKIIKISKDRKLMDEGCLSVRPLFGKVRRATRVAVQAYDENGHLFEMEGSGLLAHIFQHETDHLNGVLFTDKAKDLREVKQLS